MNTAEAQQHSLQLRAIRQNMDGLLNAGLARCHAGHTRYISLARTHLEFGRAWLGKALGALPGNPNPYTAGQAALDEPHNTYVPPTADLSTADIDVLETQIFRRLETLAVQRVKRLRTILHDSQTSISGIRAHLDPYALGDNGLSFYECLSNLLYHLHEASIALGYEVSDMAHDKRGGATSVLSQVADIQDKADVLNQAANELGKTRGSLPETSSGTSPETPAPAPALNPTPTESFVSSSSTTPASPPEPTDTAPATWASLASSPTGEAAATSSAESTPSTASPEEIAQAYSELPSAEASTATNSTTSPSSPDLTSTSSAPTSPDSFEKTPGRSTPTSPATEDDDFTLDDEPATSHTKGNYIAGQGEVTSDKPGKAKRSSTKQK